MVMRSAERQEFRGWQLAPLPGTERELEFLKEGAAPWRLKVKGYKGEVATEAELRSIQHPFILHLATHGRLLPDEELTSTKIPPLGLLEERKPMTLMNPMQRSVLALAGAQTTLDAWKRGEIPPTENDGILMAEEVGTLNLNGTWLVVLSACDTGLGEMRAGEGVLGLRRGFVQAGAQNLLMTLWPVSDKWTVEIMKDFYDRAMQTGDAPQALADVQRDRLVRLKKEKGALLAARIAGPFILTFQGGGR